MFSSILNAHGHYYSRILEVATHNLTCANAGCSLISALSYGVASMAMVFINKAVLMQYSDSMTLLTLQVYCN